MAKKTKAAGLSIEEKLEQALIVPGYEPYQLPENWCWVTLGSINQYIGRSVNPLSGPNITYELYSVPSSHDDYPEIVSGSEIGSTKQSVEKGDILLCKINPRINRVWIVSNYTSNPLIASSEWIVIRSSRILPEYLMWCMRAPYFREFMLSNVSGIGGSLMRAKPAQVKQYPIALAPLPEQKHIVEHIESLFSKLDEAKEKAQAVIDSFETRKAAILHKAFSGELTAKWREGKADKSWQNIPLSEFATIVSGFAFSSNDFNKKEGVPCVKITNVGVGEYYADEYEYLPDAYLNEYPQFVVNYGDVLISLTRSYINTGLKVCVYLEPQKALLNQRVALIKDCNTRYLFYYLCSNSVLSYVKEKSKTTNQPNLSIRDLRNLMIPVASNEEQQKIVERLDELLSKESSSKQTAETVIEQIDIMKKAILSRAFRGELGTNDPSEESAVELLKTILSGE